MEDLIIRDRLTENGFARLAAVKHAVAIADVATNVERSIVLAEEMDAQGADVVVYPELNLTSYSCGDLFFDQTLQADTLTGLADFTKATEGLRPVYVIGAPIPVDDELYNTAAVVHDGEIMGLVPKQFLPNYNEFYEGRYFASGKGVDRLVEIGNQTVHLTPRQLFDIKNVGKLGVEICEDMWVPNPPNIDIARSAATIIANLSASDEVIGKHAYRQQLIASTSGRLICAYVFSGAGVEESTADTVMGGAAEIAVNGSIVAEGERFIRGNTSLVADVDIPRLLHDRRRTTTYTNKKHPFPATEIRQQPSKIERGLPTYKAHPFVPSNPAEREERCAEIIELQAQGLASRLLQLPESHRKIVLGLSGGLDSTLALLVAKHACDIIGIPTSDIHTITMPGMGSTARTQDNATRLAEALGTTHSIRPIGDQAHSMLELIGHDGVTQDIAYENTQARTRTDLLFNYSNHVGGMVLGTGDLSEMALGWCTFNGDHMSQYNVNCTIPKTLVKYLVANAAQQAYIVDSGASEVLEDILATPISPELTDNQSTEESLGPYELHDFFVYHFNRFGEKIPKIAALADEAFADQYDQLELRHTLRTFIARWFTSQWKRNVATDGPKVGTVAFSPRGDLRMPPEASMRAYLVHLDTEIAELEAAAQAG